MLEVVSTYRPRKATSLTPDEVDALHDALTSLSPGQAVVVSRQPHDTESKARTDGLAVKRLYTVAHGVDLRTHVLGEAGAFTGAVSLPLANGDDTSGEDTTDTQDGELAKGDDTSGEDTTDTQDGEPVDTQDKPKRRQR